MSGSGLLRGDVCEAVFRSVAQKLGRLCALQRLRWCSVEIVPSFVIYDEQSLELLIAIIGPRSEILRRVAVGF